ncbi:GMC family oxidoreductase N-terminal domain-containing protein [Undibacterium cyanobacteriorum]|uniref:GMC family oxidoreductase N-terminal domain-containing protein n=1 Tax=Undibacterium cyanobacteriorum TaxID=3073561 RepID=A0ABY9RFQ4_9BURK|nr:FAD-dependent oxidoreductase [Undibacterium sp. 20NA77.5]WMW80061.1 GMC family oxidoreductase N-terminal domain-containing protein [Undibacterium sp. 20NA77.5]
MQSLNQKYDVIVVGSGPAGASVARDLVRRQYSVLLIEQGSASPLTGSLWQMARMAAIPGRGAYFNKDASLLVSAVTAGGSSAINYATAMKPPMEMFAKYGIDLQPAYDELRREIPMAPLPDHLLGPMAKCLMHSAVSMGLPWQKFEKMIYSDQCRTGCWRCTYGCPFGAKWTARNWIDDAIGDGLHWMNQTKVLQVLHENGKCLGVVVDGEQGIIRIGAKRVVLAAGGIGSPRLLHASGLAPKKASHFTDPVVAVMGSVDDIEDVNAGAEVPMVAGMHLQQEGITLADMTLPRAMYQAFTAQVGRFDRLGAHARTLSMMVKIRDEIGGEVGPHWVNKTLHVNDKKKLQQGVELARSILAQSGAKHVFKSWHFSAHPGGSVRIGEGVDSALETSIKDLYVCDASVIPEAWGLAPSVTLLCLGKRLAQHLADGLN